MTASIDVVVRAVRQEAPDVRSYRLVRPDGAGLPAWTPGAHIDVHLDTGLTRPYSLCGSPGDCASYLVAVKREPRSGGGSAAMHERVQAGSRLRISPPRNAFALCAAAARHLLLAGGIGITPLLAMARALARDGASFRLHYFTRSPGHAAFDTVLRTELPPGAYTPHPGLAAEAVEQALRAILGTRRAGEHLYLCGPRPFMDAARQIAGPAWPLDAVHLEHFGAAPAPAAADGAFIVRLAKSGGQYRVANGESIVAALARHGIYIDTSCEQGVCGTCVVDVLEGAPDHRDEVLTDDERRACTKIAACVSRSLGPLLVLDL